MLRQRVLEWTEEWRQEGLQKGLEEGRERGLQEGRERGLREGRQEGRREGRREVLLRQLERKFGQVDSATRDRIDQADDRQLLTWGENLLSADRLEDVWGSIPERGDRP